MVIDSNIIIYASYPSNQYLRDFISSGNAVISTISVIETLGYHKISLEDIYNLKIVIDSAVVVDLTREIVDRAIIVRISKKISLPDAIIAATALHFDYDLVTNNEEDFKGIEGLRVINPMKNHN